MGLSPEMRRQLHRHFPTLLVALSRAARSLPGAFLVIAKRLRHGITRRRMIAVALVALVLSAVLERRSRFLRLAEYHRSQVDGVLYVFVIPKPDRVCVDYWIDAQGRQISSQQVQWHDRLSFKYRDPAARPWLPVEPDPPPPP
jgi:hypothetical protein